MKNLLKNRQFLIGLLSVVASVFLVAVIVYGATTIGTNIQTAGTASSTSATTTAYLYVGPDGTEDYFDFSGGDLYVADDAEIDGAFYVTGASTFTGLATFDHATTTSATTTDYLYIGPDGTEDNFNFAGGDLYVADDVEIDGSLWVDSATTTDSLAIGGYASSTGNINTQSAIHVGGNLDVDGTTTMGPSGSAITQLNFGTCNIPDTSVTASTTAYANCSGATGVAAGDNIFVTATSSLPEQFIIQAASSSAATVINLRIYHLGYDDSITSTGVKTFFWQAMR